MLTAIVFLYLTPPLSTLGKHSIEGRSQRHCRVRAQAQESVGHHQYMARTSPRYQRSARNARLTNGGMRSNFCFLAQTLANNHVCRAPTIWLAYFPHFPRRAVVHSAMHTRLERASKRHRSEPMITTNGIMSRSSNQVKHWSSNNMTLAKAQPDKLRTAQSAQDWTTAQRDRASR